MTHESEIEERRESMQSSLAIREIDGNEIIEIKEKGTIDNIRLPKAIKNAELTAFRIYKDGLFLARVIKSETSSRVRFFILLEDRYDLGCFSEDIIELMTSSANSSRELLFYFPTPCPSSVNLDDYEETREGAFTCLRCK